MKKNRIWILGFVMVLIPFIVSAQDARSTAGVKGICENFLSMIQNNDYNGAFSYIRSKPNSIPDQQFEDLESTTIQQSQTINNLYGKAYRFILVSEKNVSDAAFRLEYLMIRQNLPIRWKFIYYKPGGDWKLVAIEFDDKIKEVF